MRSAVIALLVVACGGGGAGEIDGGMRDAAAADAMPAPSPANIGWIGGACDAADDCQIGEPICLVDGFPNGMCTTACAGLCPDRGEPGDTVSFCIDGIPYGFDEGVCAARCDTVVLPGDGCPEGYRCVPRNRYADPAVVVDVCLPDAPDGACEPGAVDELIPLAYPDSGALWIPREAQCGGAFDLIIMLHGINPSSNPAPSLGGGRRLEVEVRAFIDAGLVRPLILAEPVHFQGSSSLLYGAEYDLTAHLDMIAAVLAPRGISVASLSYTGHSGAGCDSANGLYKVLAERDSLIPAYAPSLALWGLEDVCYSGDYHWLAPRGALAGSGTAIINMFTVQGDPTAFEAGLLDPGPVDMPCRDALYLPGTCLRHPTEPWCSFRTRSTAGVSHDNNPWFFVREAFPRVFPVDGAPAPCD